MIIMGLSAAFEEVEVLIQLNTKRNLCYLIQCKAVQLETLLPNIQIKQMLLIITVSII